MNGDKILPDIIIRLGAPYKLPTWNEVNRMNRTDAKWGATQEKRWRRELGFLIRANRPRKHQNPVYIWFHYYEPDSRRDPDNIEYFRKPFLDALQDCAVIPKDSRRYIKGFRSEFFTDRKDPRIEVYIEDAE